MFSTLFHVALGAALGGAARYGVGVWMLRTFGTTAFPLGVITVNVVGSFLMGALVVYFARHGLNAWAPFVMTGVLGGFTTFSAFSLETVVLIERGHLGLAAGYVLGSVILSVAALFAGMMLVRGMAA